MILLRHGRVAAAGEKRAILTAEHMSALFDSPIVVDESDGYFYWRPAAATSPLEP